MAIQPGSANPQGGQAPSGTSELPAVRGRRKRRPGLAALFALIGLGGLAFAGLGVIGQLRPRVFTPGQRAKIEAWEVAKRWRTTEKTQIFPALIRYQLPGGALGSTGSLSLTARRLAIARQATCASVAGAKSMLPLFRRAGCQALLRATYTDETSSFVVTVGVAVLGSDAGTTAVARTLTNRPAAGSGAVARLVVLRPLPVPDSPAAGFGVRQRQLSWVAGSRSYLVVATVGFADGRPRVQVITDSYTYLEMTSLARAVADVVAAPLGAAPPVPRCPQAGTPPCLGRGPRAHAVASGARSAG